MSARRKRTKKISKFIPTDLHEDQHAADRSTFIPRGIRSSRATTPAEGWGWCYIDESFIDLGDDTTPQLGPIPRYV
jgi:hypothetical protein